MPAGLTPTKKVKDELPDSADEATAIGLFEKYRQQLKPLEKEQIESWFQTWDGNNLGALTACRVGELPLTVRCSQVRSRLAASRARWKMGWNHSPTLRCVLTGCCVCG